MKVCVYGMGRFGRFWAMELSRVIPGIMGYNRTPRELPKEIHPASLEDLYEADVVILTTAISSMGEVLDQIAPHLKENVLVMDCCSVKVWPIEQMVAKLSPSARIMGTHPMFGPDSGKEGVQGLPLVICPVRGDEDLFQYWNDLFNKLGLNVQKMTPDEHDREAAFTQGITHFIGRTLNEMGLKESSMGTSGYKSLQKIVEQTCNDPWQLFIDLQMYNPHTEEMRSKLDRVLAKMIKYIQP
jgi:prephenate dehydrogenase